MNISASQLTTLFNNLMLDTALKKMGSQTPTAILSELLKQGIEGDDAKNLVETFAKSLFLQNGAATDKDNVAILHTLIKTFSPLKMHTQVQQLTQIKEQVQNSFKQLISHLLTSLPKHQDPLPHAAYRQNQLLRSPELLQQLSNDIQKEEIKHKKEQEFFGLAQPQAGKNETKERKKRQKESRELVELIQLLLAIKSGLEATLKALINFQQHNTESTVKQCLPDFEERLATVKAMLKECNAILRHTGF